MTNAAAQMTTRRKAVIIVALRLVQGRVLKGVLGFGLVGGGYAGFGELATATGCPEVKVLGPSPVPPLLRRVRRSLALRMKMVAHQIQVSPTAAKDKYKVA